MHNLSIRLQGLLMLLISAFVFAALMVIWLPAALCVLLRDLFQEMRRVH